MKKISLVIMAAGMGSRYGGLKQIEPVGNNGEVLMDYAIYDAYRAGIRDIKFIIRDDFRKEFIDLIQTKWCSMSDIHFSYINQDLNDLPKGYKCPKDRVKPWGTTHVLYALRGLQEEEFIILNADDYYGNKAIQSLVDFLNEKETGHAMASYRLGDTLSKYGTVTRGICKTRGQKLVSLDEKKSIAIGDLDENLPVSMNIWAFRASILNKIEKDFSLFLDQKLEEPKSERLIPETINDLLLTESIEVNVLETGTDWIGMTYPEDRELVKQKLNEKKELGLYPPNIFTCQAQ